MFSLSVRVSHNDNIYTNSIIFRARFFYMKPSESPSKYQHFVKFSTKLFLIKEHN